MKVEARNDPKASIIENNFWKGKKRNNYFGADVDGSEPLGEAAKPSTGSKSVASSSVDIDEDDDEYDVPAFIRKKVK